MLRSRAQEAHRRVNIIASTEVQRVEVKRLDAVACIGETPEYFVEMGVANTRLDSNMLQ